jgi:glycosyltransferase involved in cell wall biosynthesis
MEIHQLLVGASPGDAITNAALDLRNLLRQFCASEVYARFFDARLSGDVLPLRDFRRRQVAHPEENIIIFHASIGEPEVFSFIQERPERLVIVHHNISPPGPFIPYDPAFAGLLDGGRRELMALSKRAVMALADSHYNAEHLASLGYRNVRVSPLILDVQRLLEVEPHEATASHLEKEVRGPVALFVGQLLPHKQPDFLIQAYHALVTNIEPDAHLIVVGPSRLPQYTAALELLVRELQLPHAWLTGRVTDAELVAFYRRADVFVTTSEHEGFCAPLLEAMAFEVPIIARGFAAIPETLGDAGLLLPPDDGPLLIAEAMGELLANAPLRSELVGRGRRRLHDFDPDKARATVLTHLLELV